MSEMKSAGKSNCKLAIWQSQKLNLIIKMSVDIFKIRFQRRLLQTYLQRTVQRPSFKPCLEYIEYQLTGVNVKAMLCTGLN